LPNRSLPSAGLSVALAQLQQLVTVYLILAYLNIAVEFFTLCSCKLAFAINVTAI